MPSTLANPLVLSSDLAKTIGMTNAAAPLAPSEIRTHLVGDREISVMHVGAGGCTVQVRDAGRTTSSKWFQFESQAVRHYAELVEANPIVAPAPAKLQPAASGTQTKVSDPGHTVLAVAALNGIVYRGGQPGEATVAQLKALVKRGYLDLTYETGRNDLRKVVVGGRITRVGMVRLAELTADEREAAEAAAKLAHVLTNVAAA